MQIDNDGSWTGLITGQWILGLNWACLFPLLVQRGKILLKQWVNKKIATAHLTQENQTGSVV